MSATDPLREICGHVQAAGSAVEAALQACIRLPVQVVRDTGTSGDLASIRRCLVDAGRLLARAERVAYRLPRAGEPDSAEG